MNSATRRRISVFSCVLQHTHTHAPLGFNSNAAVEMQSFTFKVHFSVPIRVEYVDDPLHQRVLLEFWQRHELLHTERARVI